MQNYAIISTGGKQLRVREGDTVEVEKLEGEAGDPVTFDRVLLTSLGGNVSVGAPEVSGAQVVGEITGQVKAPKVTAFRFKNKTRSGVSRGHRQPLTSVLIKSIES